MFNVVVVDDNSAMAHMLTTSIPWEELGCAAPIMALNGTEGRRAILSTSPDLIIADINMPGMDGLTMIRLCSEIASRAKIIFISAYDDFTYAYEAIQLHVFAYLLKPFANDQLIELIQQAVRQLKEQNMPEGALVPDVSADAGQPLMVERICEYINAHISAPLSLAEIADYFQLSAPYTGQLIKKHTGMNFSELLTRTRICVAKKLLKDPRYRVEEVSALVGYKNYITFYRAFVRYEDISPTGYRNSKRQG